jgi:hypothetical protein
VRVSADGPCGADAIGYPATYRQGAVNASAGFNGKIGYKLSKRHRGCVE